MRGSSPNRRGKPAPSADTTPLHRLKKEKLKIKEEMEGLTHH